MANVFRQDAPATSRGVSWRVWGTKRASSTTVAMENLLQAEYELTYYSKLVISQDHRAKYKHLLLHSSLHQQRFPHDVDIA